MKAVNLYSLASSISSQVEIVGKRPGEQLNETIVNEDELPFTYQMPDYILIKPEVNPSECNKLSKKIDSENTDKMTSNEMKMMLDEIRESIHENINQCHID